MTGKIVLQSSEVLSMSNGVKVLVYSSAGMGKTMLCATAPMPVVISAESGILSLSRSNIERVFGKKTKGITYNLAIIEIESIDDLTDAREWCESKEAEQFETVCLDSISEMAEVVLNNAKRQVKDPRQAYGELMEKMGTTIRSFRDLKGKHVYMTSKEDYIKDEVNGTCKFGPMMPGKQLAKDLPYLYDEVFNLNIAKLENGKPYRYLRTQPDIQFHAKDRSGALDEIEEPNLTKIFNKIKAGA